MDSILTSVKKLLGLTEEYTAFDADLIMHINSVLMILRQMGVGPQEGFGISDATATWSEFCQNRADIEAVKQVIASLSQLSMDTPAISEIEINPLIVYPEGQGAISLDSRAILAK